VDFIALSFVRERKDVEELRAILRAHNSAIRIISKIEDQEAVKNLHDLVDVSDGIMVARGDLGVECPYEELPIIQRRAVKACLRQGKPVIVATHMLESMIENPMPTRAEVTDVANAVFEQADAIMLSGETTVGKYPLGCIEVLDRIARRTERSGGAGYSDVAQLKDVREKMIRSAVVMANELEAKGILVFTRQGYMARCTSWLRPKSTPIYAFTSQPLVCHQLCLQWGVTPFVIDFSHEPETTILRAEALLRDRGLVARGDQVVVITDVLARDKLINTVQMRAIE
jgi:pyruvate kinase